MPYRYGESPLTGDPLRSVRAITSPCAAAPWIIGDRENDRFSHSSVVLAAGVSRQRRTPLCVLNPTIPSRASCWRCVVTYGFGASNRAEMCAVRTAVASQSSSAGEVPRARWRGASVFSPALLTQRSLIPLAVDSESLVPTFRVSQHPKQTLLRESRGLHQPPMPPVSPSSLLEGFRETAHSHTARLTSSAPRILPLSDQRDLGTHTVCT